MKALDGKNGGSASCPGFACLCVVVLAVMICQASCDHRRPCRSFLTNSFVSCKDRALERDRPYRRKKNSVQGAVQGGGRVMCRVLRLQ